MNTTQGRRGPVGVVPPNARGHQRPAPGRPKDARIGAGGPKPAEEKWFYPGRWLVQGTVFAVAALTVRAVWNAVTSSDSDDADEDAGTTPARREEGSDAA